MKLECTNCGADVPIDAHSDYVVCEYCQAALIVDRDRTALHYVLPREVEDADVAPLLRRSLAALEVVEPARVVETQCVYWPYWRFERAGREAAMLAASSPPVEELTRIALPFGAARVFDEELRSEEKIIDPETLLAEEAPTLEEGEVVAALVHVPVIAARYGVGASEFEAWIDGVSGRVFAEVWPPAAGKGKTRLMALVAGGTFTVLLAESLSIESMAVTAGVVGLTACAIYLTAKRGFRDHGW
jgi:DNA-directed RNA polymerase subunit RPC12/RpoP